MLTNKVCFYRLKRNLSQRELASAVGVCENTIIYVEHGLISPRLDLALRLSNFFKVPLFDLFEYQSYN